MGNLRFWIGNLSGNSGHSFAWMCCEAPFHVFFGAVLMLGSVWAPDFSPKDMPTFHLKISSTSWPQTNSESLVGGLEWISCVGSPVAFGVGRIPFKLPGFLVGSTRPSSSETADGTAEPGGGSPPKHAISLFLFFQAGKKDVIGNDLSFPSISEFFFESTWTTVYFLHDFNFKGREYCLENEPFKTRFWKLKVWLSRSWDPGFGQSPGDHSSVAASTPVEQNQLQTMKLGINQKTWVAESAKNMNVLM